MAESARRAAFLLLALLAAAASAQPAPDVEPGGGPLTVAVTEAPPFAERSPDGVWDGLGVAVAEDVGQVLGRPVQVVGVPHDSVLAVVARGEIDLVLTTMTAAGEAVVDFSAPFYSARLGVARERGNRVFDVLGRLFTMTFFWIAAGIAVLLLIVGAIMWVVERRSEGDDFRAGPRGLWDGFWWAGVTMTTIGYGDTVPTSVGGRVIALFWMLVSMAVTAALTASLVSALGLRTAAGGGAGGTVSLPEDLQGERVGVVEGSAAGRVLREARVETLPFPSAEAGLGAVEADSLDAFVGSAPSLRSARSAGSMLRIETTGAELERWAFATAEGSPLREAISRAVLERVHSPEWPSVVRRYVGSE